MPQRVLSEAEFNTIRDHVVAAAPDGLDETNFNRYIGPAMAFAVGKAENESAKVEGSALTRFASGAWHNLNPVSIAEGLYGAARHPIDTATNIIASQADQGRQALASAKAGQYSEAIGHGAAAALPILGPAAAAAGDQIASGDMAGGVGSGAGLLASLEAPRAMSAGARVVRALPASAAAAADAGAAARVVDVMAPKVGANKARFGNMAQKVAPTIAEDIAKDGAPLSREGLHQMVQDKLAAASEALDAAHDARFKSATFPTKPLIDDLIAKRKALMSEAVDASEITPKRGIARSGDGTITETKTAVPIGKDVIPPEFEPRAARIDQAIADLKQLGPIATYDAIRNLRMGADTAAKAIYSPAVTADFMKVQGSKLGAADVAGSMRDSLAAWDPKVAEANKPYAVYKTANDVMDATAEVERTRPKVGRVIAARVMATLLGEHAAGPAGAVAGYALAPVLDAALSSGMTTKLKTSAALTNLSRAIRGGSLPHVDSALQQLKRIGVTAAAVRGQATSPSESQSQTTGAASY